MRWEDSHFLLRKVKVCGQTNNHDQSHTSTISQVKKLSHECKIQIKEMPKKEAKIWNNNTQSADHCRKQHNLYNKPDSKHSLPDQNAMPSEEYMSEAH